MATKLYDGLIVGYGVSDCPYCLRACADLMDANIPYSFVNMDFAGDFHDNVKEKFQWPTFPIIVHEENEKKNLIGGYEQLKARMR